MWLVAGAALIPVFVPFGAMLVRVAGGGSSAASTFWSVRTAELLLNTMTLVAAVVATSAAIGIGAAWLTARTELPGRRWTVIIALPLVIPSYVVALALRSAFGGSGLIADATGLGVPQIDGFWGAWLALTIATYPFVYLVAASALRRIGRAQEEAARGLGASPWRVFRTVVLPQLRPSVAAGTLLVALYTLSDFGAVSLMRFDAFTRVIYAQYSGRLDRTPAAVLAVVLVVVALAVLWAEERTRSRAAYATPHVPTPQRSVRLTTRQTIAATVGLVVLALLALGLPIAALLSWLARGTGATLDWGAVAGSLAGSTLAGAIAFFAAIPTAVLVVRHASRRTAWLERSIYAMFALPHITVALAVVFFASRYLGGLYQSLMLMTVVYASVFFAEALGAGKAALLQVDPSLEEASRGLGRGPLATLTRITVPLIWKGLLAGAVLVFLTTMKELPITLLLRPTGFDTLAVDIWSAADDLLYARAAAPALLLLAVSAVPMYLLATRTNDR
jgi:iron(III) transport system permease protein